MITQPNRWTCFPTSLAILIDVPVKSVLDAIGHDGSEIWWPKAKEPARRRSFHPQEIVDAAYKLGYFLVLIERMPLVTNPTDYSLHRTADYPQGLDARMKDYLSRHNGILGGWTANRCHHAVAWKNQKIIDPKGHSTITIDNFEIEHFWIIHPK